MRSKVTKSEKMGKLNIYLKFIEIFPQYKLFSQRQKSNLGMVDKFLSKIKERPESIKLMKNCVVCRTGSSGPDGITLCWNCMTSIPCIDYNPLTETFIEHNNGDEFTNRDSENGCFNMFGDLDKKNCIHKN